MSKRDTLIPLSAGMLVVAALLAFTVIRLRSKGTFAADYERLSLGRTFPEVVDIMGSAPRYEYTCGSFRIMYYRSPSMFCRDPGIVDYKPGETVLGLDELPDLYGFVQLAFNSNDVLVAYTWIGESYTVESLRGPVKGSHLSVLRTLDGMD